MKTKSIKKWLQAALILDGTYIKTLRGAGKLTDEEISDLIHLSACVSNELGEMEVILKKFKLERI